MTRPTFKACLVNIQAKSGKTPDEFWKLANKKGFIKRGEVVTNYSEMLTWLKSMEMGLGQVHSSCKSTWGRVSC